MIKTSRVTRVLLSGAYEVEAGDRVVANLLSSPKEIGDEIRYAEIRSVVTKRFGGRSTQWTAQTATGKKFFKECSE